MDQAYFTHLFRLYISGKCSPEERNEFFDLLEANKEDNTMISLLDQLYSEVRLETPSATYVNNRGEIDLAVHPAAPAKVVPFYKRRSTIRVAAAASLLLLLGTGAWMLSTKRNPAPLAAGVQKGEKLELIAATTTIRTGNKERKVIVLSDSTRIVLNSGTEIRYPDQFDPQKREIFLEGEAFFEVSNAAAWPFVIHSAGGMTTTVLGTSFNIKAYPGRSQAIVSVVTGKVKISKDKKDISTLIKGQELHLTMLTGEVMQRNTISINTAGWQTGDISFSDEPLEDIMKDLQIFYGVNIKISNPGLANLLITTGFKKNTSVDSALDIICELANAKYARNQDGYVVY
ncbi:FecR family protein [Chitinophaga ginsengisegetis]|uniref:FecR family protein n=1 Tax=Chitinophaga ginsengisegetis TaxID=393003 RepID=A0A1T5PA87_9BACT|nr:FecR family protein [Chitinophaga ginsengisegetis]SKD09298.1 FecR family protein [Chitinophaga ginsengisegetis]